MFCVIDVDRFHGIGDFIQRPQQPPSSVPAQNPPQPVSNPVPAVAPQVVNDAIIQVQFLPVDQSTNRRDLQPGDIFVSHYGYWGDLTPDTNSQRWRGSRGNQLTVDSLAISNNVASQYRLASGGPVYVNGIFVGNYDDTAPETNTIDAFDPFYQLPQNWGGVMRNGAFVINGSGTVW
jgi:hypothetical protein